MRNHVSNVVAMQLALVFRNSVQLKPAATSEWVGPQSEKLFVTLSSRAGFWATLDIREHKQCHSQSTQLPRSLARFHL